MNQWETAFFLSLAPLWDYRFDKNHCKMELYHTKDNDQWWESRVTMSDKVAEIFLFLVPHGTLRNDIDSKVRSRVNNGQWNPKTDIIR